MNIFSPTNILLPQPDIDFSKWSVVACDQFTSQPEYWVAAKKNRQGVYSSINLILPEAELQGDLRDKIDDISKNMRLYLNGNVFEEYKSSFIYVERTLENGKIRQGIVGALDLET